MDGVVVLLQWHNDGSLADAEEGWDAKKRSTFGLVCLHVAGLTTEVQMSIPFGLTVASSDAIRGRKLLLAGVSQMPAVRKGLDAPGMTAPPQSVHSRPGHQADSNDRVSKRDSRIR